MYVYIIVMRHIAQVLKTSTVECLHCAMKYYSFFQLFGRFLKFSYY